MDTTDFSAWALVNAFLASPTLWGTQTFVAKTDRLWGWSAADIDLAPSDADDPSKLRQRVRRWAALSRLADQIPTEQRVVPDGNSLSRLTHQILTQGECATGVALTKAEKDKLEDSRQVLFDADVSGVLQPSAKYKAYSRYKSEYYAAEQALRGADLQAQTLGDLNQVEQFHSITRPALVEAARIAKVNWVALGYWSEVQDALDLNLRFAERAPSEAWSKFRSSFLPAELKDLDGWGFYPVRTTPESPADLMWQHAKAHVPLDQKYKSSSQLFAGVAEKLDFDRVEFEYAFLRIDRGWLDSSASVLHSRIWQHKEFPPSSLSDGRTPPNGKCPGFAIGFILVRSLKVFSKHLTTTTSSGKDVKITFGEQQFLSAAKAGGASPALPVDLAAFPSSHAKPTAMSKVKEFLNQKEIDVTAHGSIDLGGQPQLFATSDAQPIKEHVSFNDHIWDAKDFASPLSAGLMPKIDVESQYDETLEDLIKRLKLHYGGSKPQILPKYSLDKITTTTESVRVLIPNDRIILGGILCKTLPASPNPDPGLVWG